MPTPSIPSPIHAASALAEAALVAAEPGAPTRLASTARQLWQAEADPVTLSQAATLVAAERPLAVTLSAVGIPHDDLTLLPRALAVVAVVSAAADWSAVEPEVAPGLVTLVLRRLRAAGYQTRGVNAAAVYAASWLSTPGHPSDAAVALLARGEDLIAAGLADAPQSLVLGRGLVAAGRRRIQYERNGLVLPAEARVILGGHPLTVVTEATGVPSSALSNAMAGVRRWPDVAALWLHALSDAPADTPMVPQSRRGRGRPRTRV